LFVRSAERGRSLALKGAPERLAFAVPIARMKSAKRSESHFRTVVCPAFLMERNIRFHRGFILREVDQISGMWRGLESSINCVGAAT
jgi:hypothetical protein